MGDYILEVKDLRTYFYTRRGVVKAVDGVSFSIRKGEIFGLVGETGCGKTVTGLSILRLVDAPGRIVSGEVRLDGVNLLELADGQMREIRGRDITMISQEPREALNPILDIGLQVRELLEAHKRLDKETLHAMVVESLSRVGLPDAEMIVNRFPFELSGGMAQRAVIAMALFEPKLIIADEPTSSLDVTIAAQILDLIKTLIRKKGCSSLFITHDLGVASDLCDRIGVLYAGQLAEVATAEQLFSNPCHPYTKGLLDALPRPDSMEDLQDIGGEVPDMRTPPSGCRFHPRCPFAMDVCSKVHPEIVEVEPHHMVACHLYSGRGRD